MKPAKGLCYPTQAGGQVQAGSSERLQAPSQELEVEVAVEVFPSFRRKVSRPWLRRLALLTLASEAEAGTVISSRDVSLLIADDCTLQELNRRYRGLDEVTDVLAFSPVHAGSDAPEGEGASPDASPFLRGDGEEESLGDVLISYPQAERQARERGIALRRELALLVVHGLLHLLGYDHDDPEGERRMWERQDAILARVLREA